MVIPSRYEPFGLVVNEAILCSCPVVASDRVGAVRDLITPGETGYVYPCGNTDALAALLKTVLADPPQLQSIRERALHRIATWTPQASADALVGAVEQALARKSGTLTVATVSSEKYT
jgi:glycosyltransferase involved in cell wall biosynthesis